MPQYPIIVPKVFGQLSSDVYVWLTEPSCVAITTRRAILPDERAKVQRMAEAARHYDYRVPDFVLLLEAPTEQTLGIRELTDTAQTALIALKTGKIDKKSEPKLARWITFSGEDTILPLRSIKNGGSTVRMAATYNRMLNELDEVVTRWQGRGRRSY